MLFDKQTGLLNLDEQVQSRASFQKIMQDQIVTDQEVEEQSQLVIKLLKELEATLSPVFHLLRHKTINSATNAEHQMQKK